MDYCKLEKIFVIVFIILFIIFAPEFVFASDSISIDSNFNNDSFTINIPDWILNEFDYYFCIYNTFLSSYYTSPNSPGFSILFLCSKTPIKYKKVDYSNGSTRFYFYGSMRRYQMFNTSWNSSKTYLQEWLEDERNFNSLEDSCDFSSSQFDIRNNSCRFFSNHDVLDYNSNDIIFSNSIVPDIKCPEIITSQEKLQNLNFKNLEVDLHDYQGQDVYLLAYDKSSTTNIEDSNGNTIDYNALYTDMISDVLGLDNSSSEYATADDLVKLYPRKEILLNSDSSYYKGELIDNGSNYSIPIDELGLSFKIDGNYAFRFAIREPIESEYSDWAYTYLGDTTEFVVIKNMSGMALEELEKESQEKQRQKEREENKKLQQEQTNAIRDQTAQDGEFYNNILSNDYDENTINNGLTGSTGGANDVDDSEYTGLFSAIFGKLSSIINGNYSSVEEIRYPIPNTNEEIVLKSDLLSSKIQGTFIYVFLQAFWLYLFGMYIFKFSNNLIRKIKSGSILNGYENNDEVITSTML